MATRWAKDWVREFQASSDPDELASASTPMGLVVGPGLAVVLLLAISLYPPLAKVSQLHNPWPSVLLLTLGAALTYLAYRQGCRGPWGTAATLLDNVCYSTGLALAAANSAGGVGVALAVVHAALLVLVPAQYYAPSRLFGLVMIAPVVTIVAIERPPLPVALVLLSSLVLASFTSVSTGQRRSARKRQARLEEALGAADRLADESLQTALTTTLLTLGHFLHELRNYQMAVATNLEFVELASELQPETADALREAREAQQRQAELVKGTIDELRSRAQAEHIAFSLRAVLEEFVAQKNGPRIDVQGNCDLELTGNPQHMRVVLLNLIRNADQAGARRVLCVLEPEPSGSALRLHLQDDGPGVSESQRSHLFDSFHVSTKSEGSGLGLYLVRRHVELLGGSVRVDEHDAKGLRFVLRLPGRVRGTDKQQPPVVSGAVTLAR